MTKKTTLPKAALEFFQQQGRKGGETRASRLSPKERSEAARKAVQARWAKKQDSKKDEPQNTRRAK
ncbi:MAG TPA: hypothetical protein VD837_09275 [Terriglobales bacterium]|nr:hypothetical protein [Terriglobales bacterium]